MPLKMQIYNNDASNFELFLGKTFKFPDEIENNGVYRSKFTTTEEGEQKARPMKLVVKANINEKSFWCDYVYIGIKSTHRVSLTIYYCFHRELMSIQREPKKDIQVRKIQVKSIQEKHDRELEQIVNDDELLEEFKEQLSKIKRRRLKKCKSYAIKIKLKK